MSSNRWIKTTYVLTLYQDEKVGSEAVPDKSQMMTAIDREYFEDRLSGFQALDVAKEETVFQPTSAEEVLRHRVFEALDQSGPMAPGLLLFDFARKILVEVDDWEDLDQDTAHEIADGAVPIYNRDRMALFTESPDLATWDSEIEASDMATLAGYVLYDLAYAIAEQALRERVERESDGNQR